MSLKKNDENGKDRFASRFTAGSVAAKTTTATVTASSSTTAGSAGAKTASRKNPSQQEIAARAWEIWKSRGCQAGRDVENWLEAEKQLRS